MIRLPTCLSDLKGLKLTNVKIDNFILKKVTEGQRRTEILVFHIYNSTSDKKFEHGIDHVNRNSITLRYFFGKVKL